MKFIRIEKRVFLYFGGKRVRSPSLLKRVSNMAKLKYKFIVRYCHWIIQAHQILYVFYLKKTKGPTQFGLYYDNIDNIGSTMQSSQRIWQSSIRNIWASRPHQHGFHLWCSSPAPWETKVPESLNATWKCKPPGLSRGCRLSSVFRFRHRK
jgi:hypothetical protein